MSEFPKRGQLFTRGWAGLSSTVVLVIGETPKKYRIRAIMETKLAGRNRWLKPAETTLVPKSAIDFI